MGYVTKETASEIALAYREVDVAEKLLTEVRKEIDEPRCDIRDAFGRRQRELQLGVPTGDSSQRLFGVPYSLAAPIIEAHIAHHKARIAALSDKASSEVAGAVA